MKSRILPFQTLLSFQTLPTTLLPFQTLPFQTQILVRLQARLPFQTLPTTLREERKWMSRRAWPRASVSGGAAGPPFAHSDGTAQHRTVWHCKTDISPKRTDFESNSKCSRVDCYFKLRCETLPWGASEASLRNPMRDPPGEPLKDPQRDPSGNPVVGDPRGSWDLLGGPLWGSPWGCPGGFPWGCPGGSSRRKKNKK